MRAIGLGIQSFEKIRKSGQFYVDKTALIGAWYRRNDDITLITRPRRFGKTLTIDMLHCFFSTEYEGRKDLFDGLAVSRDGEMMELQGTMPVIRISFAGVKADTFRGFLVGLAGKLSILLNDYRYLLDGDLLTEDEKQVFRFMNRAVPDIPDREKDEKAYTEYLYQLTHILHLLSIWLFRCHKKLVYIFMDEYDTPIQAAYMNHYYEAAIQILRELFSETFKENMQLGRALITGITRIAKESLFSEMNNLAVCGVLSGGYDSLFGFTKAEMEEILAEFDASSRQEEIRFWYDGFTVGEEAGIYNPWSVISFLANRNKPLTDYWAQSGGLGLVDHLVKRGGIDLKEGFEALLRGGMIARRIREDLIFPRLDHDENAVWSLLIAAGYVKPSAASGNGKETVLTLTNHESQKCLSEMVTGWFETVSGNYMVKFADALLAGDVWAMNEQMGKVVLESVSSFDSGVKPSERNALQPENFFHALALGMLTCLSDEYKVVSNREAGFGRYDVCLIPLDRGRDLPACILEFKVFDKGKGDKTIEDTARRALRQIEENRYDADLIADGFFPEKIKKYGFGFRGKEVRIVE